MTERRSRFYYQWQFWLTIAGMLFSIIGGVSTVLWTMSSEITKYQNNLVRIERKVDIGFTHVSNALDRKTIREEQFNTKIEEIHRKCCSEIYASNE